MQPPPRRMLKVGEQADEAARWSEPIRPRSEGEGGNLKRKIGGEKDQHSENRKVAEQVESGRQSDNLKPSGEGQPIDAMTRF